MTAPLDPAAAIADFLARVTPYDPEDDPVPVAMLGVRTASGDTTYTMSDHVVRALSRALAAYTDPDDRGTCLNCNSRRLDENLHCRDCGRLHGILGQVIAQHVRRAAAAAEESER